MKSYKTQMLYYALLNFHLIIKNNIFLSILTFIDFLTIFAHLMSITTKIQNGLNYNLNKSYFLQLSFYFHFSKLFDTKKCIYFIILLFIPIIFKVFFIIIVCKLNKNLVNFEDNSKKIFRKIFVNFYEIFLFRFFIIFEIEGIIGLFIYIIYHVENKIYNQLLMLLIEVLIIFYLLSFLIATVLHYKIYNCCMNITDFQATISDFPFDMNFSVIFNVSNFALKILITIDKNLVLFFGTELKRNELVFFQTIGISLYIFLFAYIIILLILKESKILYFPLNFYTKFQIFLIIFSGFSIFYGILIKDHNCFEMLFLVITTFVFLFLFFIFKYDQIILYKITNSTNLIMILKFLICSDSDKEIFMIKWLSNHKINCRKIKNCSICNTINKNILDEYKLTFENFFKLFLNCKIKNVKKNKENLISYEIIYLDILSLYSMNFNNDFQKFKFYLKFYQISSKYEKENLNVYYNLMTIFNQFKIKNKEFYNIYEGYKQINNNEILFKDFFNDIENFILYETKSPKNLINLSNKIYDFSKNPLIIKLLNNSPSNYTYDVVIMRYLFEIITKNPFNNSDFFEINNYEDFLNNHFYFDNFIVIHYNIFSESFIIIHSSSKLRKFIGKNFEKIFPKYLKKIAKEKILFFLKENNFKDNDNDFNFIINDNINNEGFVENFNLKFVMYPSEKFGEMLIYGNFKCNNNLILILFEKINNKGKNKEILVTFSFNFKKFLGLNPEIIKIFSNFNHFFKFSIIFKKINQTLLHSYNMNNYNTNNNIESSPEQQFDENETYFQINLNGYIKILKLYFDEHNDLIDNQKKNSILNDLYYTKERISNEKFLLLNTLKIKSDKNNNDVDTYYDNNMKNRNSENSRKFVLYYLKCLNKSNIYENVQETNIINVNNNNDKNDETNNLNETLTKLATTGTESISSMENNLVNGGLFKFGYKFDKDYQEEEKSYYRFHVINLILFIFNIISVIFCIIFLITQLKLDEKYLNYKEFVQKFAFFNRGMNTEIVRMISNLCYKFTVNNKETEVCNFEILSGHYLRNFNYSDQNMLLSKIIYNEFKNSINSIIERYTYFKETFYVQSQSKINSIINSVNTILYLMDNNTNNENAYLIPNNYNYIESIDIYLNFLTQVINRDNLLNTSIKFFTLTRDLKLLNTEITNVTEDQKLIYQLIVNYPFIQKSLLYIRKVIFKWFDNHYNKMVLYLYLFSGILLFLNIITFVFQFIFIFTFRDLLNKDYILFQKKIYSLNFMKYFNSKFYHMKNLINLYDKDPNEEIKLLLNEEKNYEKFINLQKKNMEKNNNNNIFEEDDEFNKNIKKNDYTIYKSYLNKFYTIIISSYFVNIAILIILFLLMNYKYKNLKTITNFFKISTDIDNYLMMNINALPFMIITNTSEKTFGELIEDDTSDISDTYVMENYEGLTEYLKQMISLFNDNKHIKNKLNEFYSYSCDNISYLNNSIWMSVFKENESDIYNEYLVKLCKSFGLFNFNDQVALFKSLTLFEQKILNSITKKPAYEKFTFLDTNSLYGVFIIILILVDIIRTHENQVLLPELLNDTLKDQNLTIVLCLVANLIIEIILTLFIYFIVSKKLINVNKRMIMLLKFFS